MDAWTFRKRITVAALAVGLILVGYDLMTGAEWVAAALGAVS